MSWLKETLTDSEGVYDVAYVSLFMVMGAVFGTILTMTAVSVASYFNCHEILNKDGTALLRVCQYDPQSLGMGVGAVCGGFATALAALAGYMAATRKQSFRENHSGPTNISVSNS